MSNHMKQFATSRVVSVVKTHPYKTIVTSAIIIAIALITMITTHGRAELHPTSSVSSTLNHSSANSSSSAVSMASSSTSSASSASGSTTSMHSMSQTTSMQTYASNAKQTSSSNSGRDVIETASLRLSVKSTSSSASTLTHMTQSVGGYVASMNESAGSSTSTAETNITLTLRVPNSDFQHFIRGAKGLGNVQTLTQSGRDVTNEHNTLTEQLSELNSESHAYTRLYDKAKSMSDMIQIQKSLSQVQSQIEQIQTKLHQLNHSVSFATIQVTLVPTISNLPQSGTNTSGAFMSSLHFMKTVGHGLLVFGAWILPWAVLGGVVFAIAKLVIRRKKH